jgi:dienelactone hydrolase
MRMRGSRAGIGLLLAAAVCGAGERTVTADRFGEVLVLAGGPPSAPVVLFISGDAGLSPNVRGMALEVAKLGAVVAVVDIWRYLHALDRAPGECSNPAQDFDALARAVERQAGYPAYRVPVLVGFSSGATLAYAVLVEAAPGTFAGAISLGFCPDLPVKKPFCPGSGLEAGPGPGGRGFSFLPAAHPSAPWVAFQGARDDDCRPEVTRAFVAKVGGAALVEIPESDHYFHQRQAWLPQLAAVLDRMAAAP